jgi:hypothetical protein
MRVWLIPQKTLSNGWPAAWLAPDPDAEATSPAAVFAAARAYVDSGLSVVPIDAEAADKAPDSRRLRSWKVYQVRRTLPEELLARYDRGGPFGLAIIGGAVSGGQPGCGLEVIDFDTAELAARWQAAVEARSPGLVQRLVRVQSPRPGLLVYYRCSTFGDCQKLACAADPSNNSNRPTKVTLIEVKGERGYCLVPPSPARSHLSNRRYLLADGSPPLTWVSIITPDERAVLIEEARKLNRWTEAPVQRVHRPTQPARLDGDRPGDDFARRVGWADILEPHGWALVRQQGEVEQWRRPGRGSGVSGTANYAGSGLFYAISTNSHPFEDGRGYSKFQAYALLNHGVDYTRAANRRQKYEPGSGQHRL